MWDVSCNLLLLSDSDRQPRALTKACQFVWRFGERRKEERMEGREEGERKVKLFSGMVSTPNVEMNVPWTYHEKV